MKLSRARDGLVQFKSTKPIFESNNEQDDLLSHPGTHARDIRTQNVKF